MSIAKLANKKYIYNEMMEGMLKIFYIVSKSK